MDPAFLLTALIVVLVPGTGVIYTLAIAMGRGPSAAFVGLRPALATR